MLLIKLLLLAHAVLHLLLLLLLLLHGHGLLVLKPDLLLISIRHGPSNRRELGVRLATTHLHSSWILHKGWTSSTRTGTSWLNLGLLLLDGEVSAATTSCTR